MYINKKYFFLFLLIFTLYLPVSYSASLYEDFGNSPINFYSSNVVGSYMTRAIYDSIPLSSCYSGTEIWCAGSSTAHLQLIQNNSNPPYFHTQESVMLTPQSGDYLGNYYQFFGYYVSDYLDGELLEYTFNNATQISFYCGLGSSTNSPYYLVFGDSDSAIFTLQLTNQNAKCSAGGTPSNCYFIQSIHDKCVNSSGVSYVNFSIGWITQQTGFTAFSGIESVQLFNIHTAFLIPFVFDDFNISDMQYGDNLLPSLDVSYNNTYICFPQDEDSIRFYVDVDSEDSEGDTIYYATNIRSLRKFGTSIVEDFYVIEDNDCKIDYAYLNSEKFILNYTTVVSPFDYAFKVLNPFWEWKVKPIVYTDESGDCNGRLWIYDIEDVPIYIDFQHDFIEDIEIDFRVNFPFNESQVNFTFYSSSLEEVVKVEFNKTTTNNVSIKVGSLTYSIPYTPEEDLVVEIDSNTNTSQFTFWVHTLLNDFTFNTDWDSTKNIRYMRINTKDISGITYFGLDYYFINGINMRESFDWSTTKPTYFTITQEGNRFYSIAVTDLYHKDVSYREEIFNVVASTEYCDIVDLYGLSPIESNPFVLLTENIFGRLAVDLGLDDEIIDMLIPAFVVLLLIAIFTMKMLFLPFFFVSLFFVVLSVVFHSVEHIIIFSVLTVVSIIGLVFVKK